MAPYIEKIMMTETEARAQFVAIALAAEGLSDAPLTRTAYRDAVIWCPEDRVSPVKSTAMGAMSSCALRALTILDTAGIRHPALAEPYPIGMAPAILEKIASDCGAVRPADYAFGLGDFVIIENGWHVLTVIARQGAMVVSVDGGQRDSLGFEAIARRHRDYDPGPPPKLGGRLIRSVLDCVAIANCERW